MRINPVLNNQNGRTNRNNQPSFKAVSVFQVNKKLFTNPENLLESQFLFISVLEDVVAQKIKLTEKPKSLIQKLASFKNSKKDKKFTLFFEQPLYSALVDMLKETGGYSLNWLSQNIKLPIKGPLSEDYHSFYVFTKEHKNSVANIFTNKNLKSISRNIKAEFSQKLNKGDTTISNPVWFPAKMNDALLKQVESSIEGEPVNIIKNDTYKELVLNILKQEY